jgi:drug/metabolite transporter (DMT)-like permease
MHNQAVPNPGPTDAVRLVGAATESKKTTTGADWPRPPPRKTMRLEPKNDGASQVDAAAAVPLSAAAFPQPAIQGAIWMLFGAAMLTVMAALIRSISSELPLATIVFFRSLFSMTMVLAWLSMTSRLTRLQTRHWRLHLLRATCGAISVVCLIVAYRHIDFALATALAFTTPFWVIILSVLFLGERPGWRRWLGTAVGFVGVLIIVRPLPVADIGVWAALAAAAFGACALSCVRRLSSLDSNETIVFYFFFFAAALSAVPAALAATVPTPAQVGLLAAIGASGVVGLAAAAQAYRLADATVVSPIDFLRLPLAALIGFLFFSEIPQWWLLMGASVMIPALWLVVSTGRVNTAPGS